MLGCKGVGHGGLAASIIPLVYSVFNRVVGALVAYVIVVLTRKVLSC